MNAKLLFGTIALAFCQSAAFAADAHEGNAETSHENAVSRYESTLKHLQRPKYRQQVLGSENAARDSARDSCQALLDERRGTAFFGVFALPHRQRALRFPDDLGRFSNRHAENSIHCSKVSLEGAYGATDRDSLSNFQTNPGAMTVMTALFLPLGLASAGRDSTELQPGQWAGISSVRMVCEARPDADILILERVRDCARIEQGAADRPTYCDGIVNAARGIERTEIIEEANCVAAD